MILGLMPIADDYRLTTAMAVSFSGYVDHLLLSCDCKSGYKGDGVGGEYYYQLFNRIPEIFNCPVTVFRRRKTGRRGGQVYGEFNRYIDKFKPELVFTCDSDETYPLWGEFWEEVESFRASGAQQMWMAGMAETVEPHSGRPYKHHCKVVKWVPGMEYGGGRGSNTPSKTKGVYRADCRMRNFPYFTEEAFRDKLNYLFGRAKRERRMYQKIYDIHQQTGRVDEFMESVYPLYPDSVKVR